jgi:hypothetical protein
LKILCRRGSTLKFIYYETGYIHFKAYFFIMASNGSYLDSAGFKGTFYVIGESEVLSNRLPEGRNASANGHELGNHTFTHAY